MKAKFFVSDTADGAIEQAVEFFKADKSQLTTEVTIEGGAAAPFVLLAAIGDSGEKVSSIDNMDGWYKLYFEEEGVFLELCEGRGAGKPIVKNDLLLYLKRKDLKLLDAAAVTALYTKTKGRAKIAPAQTFTPLPEDLLVAVAPNELECRIKLLPPEDGGAKLTRDSVVERLKAAGVIFGLIDEEIEKALSEKNYGAEYTVALAKPAENGVDGKLVYYFDIEKKSGRPHEDDSGRVDYRNLDLFEHVERGQVLLTRELATMGEPGMSVKGKTLNPKPGKDKLLPKSKNCVVNEEKTEIRAATGGSVELAQGTVVVSDVFTVKGDVDLGVGNINFAGNVVIEGSVISGMKVNATGSITIRGVVEAAEITSGSGIDLLRGIQGMDKGRIVAAGSINVVSVERATLIAGENIYADSVMHSNIEAGGSLILKGKWGRIMGGEARATNEIIATTIGTISHTQTDLEVGMVPQRRTRLTFLEDEVERIKGDVDKANKTIAYLEKVKATMPPDNYSAILRSSLENLKHSNQLLAEYSDELSILQIESDNAVRGKVHVSDVIHAGARITIANAVLRIDKQQTFSSFYYKDGAIENTSFQK